MEMDSLIEFYNILYININIMSKFIQIFLKSLSIFFFSFRELHVYKRAES